MDGDEHLKSPATFLDRDYVNREGLDLSKEALWVSVGQRMSQLPEVQNGPALIMKKLSQVNYAPNH